MSSKPPQAHALLFGYRWACKLKIKNCALSEPLLLGVFCERDSSGTTEGQAAKQRSPTVMERIARRKHKKAAAVKRRGFFVRSGSPKRMRNKK